MGDLNFQSDDNEFAQRPQKVHSSALANFLVKKGIARNYRMAEYALIACAILCALLVVFIWPRSPQVPTRQEVEQQAGPPGGLR